MGDATSRVTDRAEAYERAREAWGEVARAYNDPHPVSREEALPSAIGRARVAMDDLAAKNILFRRGTAKPFDAALDEEDRS